ncbi:glycogen synthase [Bacteroidota bacterium]
MEIILASTEATPLAKAGGLADVTASLPAEWDKLGQSAYLFMPKYSFINIHEYGFVPTYLVLYVPMGSWVEFAHLWYGKLPGTNVSVYLIENNDYFNRNGIYGDPEEYPDNDRRFIFFSRAVFEAVKALNIKPDILHAHDYHTAFTMAFLKSQYRFHPLFSNTAGVFTIHNLAYQGWFNPERALKYSQFDLKEYYPGSWFEHHGTINAMKTGIMFADKITTVSPTYAKEIRMPYYSEGLQNVLNHRAADFVGVLNGVYYSDWDPENDNLLYSKYSKDYLQGKLLNKHQYLKEKGLSEADNLNLPLLGMVTRLAEQKGIDLLINKIESLLENNICRFALLGSGEKKYEDYFNYLAWKYPGKVFIYVGYNDKLAHRIIAGSDYLLMPSRFEPCGLTQMYALKYGTIPIVRKTGGLADTVEGYNADKGSGTGFLFWQYNADDFAYSIRRALSIYNKDPHWNIIRRNAMNEDFSSSKSALEYLKTFKWALEKVRGKTK